MLEIKCIFWAEKLFSQAQFFLLKSWKINIYEYPKKNLKEKILCLKKHHTLGAGNRQFSSKRGGRGISNSYAFLGICEAGLPGAGFQIKKIFYIRKIYADMRISTPKNGFTDP